MPLEKYQFFDFLSRLACIQGNKKRESCDSRLRFPGLLCIYPVNAGRKNDNVQHIHYYIC